jgi:hypothetical protein
LKQFQVVSASAHRAKATVLMRNHRGVYHSLYASFSFKRKDFGFGLAAPGNIRVKRLKHIAAGEHPTESWVLMRKCLWALL